LPARRPAAGASFLAALVLAAALLVLVPAAAGAAAGGVLRGSVPLRGMNVVLYAARPGAAKPQALGRARSGRGGAFRLTYRGAVRGPVKYVLATRPGGGAEAGFPVPGNSYRLASAIGAGAVPPRMTLNERTTVAAGYAMAQFLEGGRLAGKDPGLRNAAAMTRNLVGLRGGGLSPVLARYPNGGSTSAREAFDSLANLLAVCRAQSRRCATLLNLSGAPGGLAAGDTLDATVNLARYPWHNSAALFTLSRRVLPRYRPALRAAPAAWTLALRFEGHPRAMDGPGNIAIDAKGSLWVGNNYEYSRRSHQATCFGKELIRFTPTGRTYPGSPYRSAGVSGVGFGITIDRRNHVWTGNFGFAGRGCKELPPSNSVSEWELDGTPVSPALQPTGHTFVKGKGLLKTYAGGWEVGGISWPQATIADVRNNIWVANCGNDSVTVLRDGNPSAAENLPKATFVRPGFGFHRPFGVTTDAEGNVYVGGNGSATVVKIGRRGEVVGRFQGGGLHRPMALASDSEGNVWVSNSTWVVAPCENQFHPESGPSSGGSVTLIKKNGHVSGHSPYRGGGLKNAWGIAVDGEDNVWVANFSGQRLSELCGTKARNCPPGKRGPGAAISPEGTGYEFDGLTRNTGLAIDPSGNVWLANNWKNVPIQTNPGGYQLVAYLGVAAPVKTPLIGAPEQP
jgi:hypothetical protein